MSGFPWDAVVPAAAALAGVFIGGRQADKTARRQRRLNDYAALVQAANALLENYQRAARAETETFTEDYARAYNTRAAELLSEVRRAFSVVELSGSSAGAAAAQRVARAAGGEASAEMMPGRDGRTDWAPEWFRESDGGLAAFMNEFIYAVRPEVAGLGWVRGARARFYFWRSDRDRSAILRKRDAMRPPAMRPPDAGRTDE
jgi:hypothetical protein